MEQSKQADKAIPTYEQVREEAGISWEVGGEDLLDKPIVILDWVPDSKIVPQTGKRTQGFTVKGTYEDDDEEFSFFAGATKLVSELQALRPPFKTTIRRSGQTYRFS